MTGRPEKETCSIKKLKLKKERVIKTQPCKSYFCFVFITGKPAEQHAPLRVDTGLKRTFIITCDKT